jgi:cytochrome c oxidase subunit 2
MKKRNHTLVIVFIFFALLISSCSKKEDEDTMKARKIIEYHMRKFDSLPLSGELVNGVRQIEVKGSQYTWEPENIVVQRGEKIKLIVTSADVWHGFELEGISIPGWDPDKLIKKGENAVIEFVAQEAGVWDVVCTGYCGPGHATMKRKYVVKE